MQGHGMKALARAFCPSRRRMMSDTTLYDRATTILCVRKNNRVVMMGDGQVSRGSTIVKPNARKVRLIGDDKVLCGFAGATADALSLLEHLESKLEEYPNQLMRAAVEMAKNWRTDKYLRRLEALLVVADKDISLTISGVGDVLQPHDGVIGIGSGGDFALAAARALMDIPEWTADQIAAKSMRIASEICVYTNDNFVTEALESSAAPSKGD